jgi:alpha,alpha-trehalase
MTRKNTEHLIAATDYDAVIFDLDGVITDTASVHAAAWKDMFDDFLSRHAERENIPFRAFDIETEYRSYVDGKPRLDGLRSFLESRGIAVPEGGNGDTPAMETVHGMARKKNANFLKRIRENGVEVYSSTVDLARSAKKHGLKTGVISSSKSCAMILDAVNLSDLFDVRVDGVISEIKGINGKPAPDIFLEAARQLNVKPERTVVIEDAVSGVQAGRAGQFGLVLGIARSGGKEELLEQGADIVVEDLVEVRIAEGPEAGDPLPSALEGFDAIAGEAGGKRLAIFLDYDGTLSPIVETPEKAIMADDMREAVIELARHCPLGIISGRDLEDVRDKVKIDSIVYAGSHGFDITGPDGLKFEDTVGEEFLPALDSAEKALKERLGSLEGLFVERKKFAIAIHYRLVAPENVERVEAVVDEVTEGHSELRKAYGKKIFELQPKVDWHKGKALFSLMKTLELDRDAVLPFYIGDDVTDEDAFRALKGRGIGIVVREESYETAAVYSLKDPEEVRAFLLRLVPLCRRSS